MIKGLVVRITLNMSFPKQRNNVVFSVPRFELLILNSGSKSREASMKIMNFLMPRQRKAARMMIQMTIVMSPWLKILLDRLEAADIPCNW
jgi:hypothetical protein